jgi:metal-sulfur cluster biosynthetic enzyme
MDPTAHSSVQVTTRTAEVWQQLTRVTDPEMDESITDLGFVATLDIHANGVTVEFRLPTYWCAANFAFMMAEDIRDQVLNLAWVDSVNVRLLDHYSSAPINEGMANAASFTETFPSEATDDLSELRRVFRRKAFMTRQEKLLGHLRRSGWNTEDLLGLTVQRLGDAVNLGNDGEQLRRRYLDIRAELGLPCGSGERAITTVDGQPVCLEGFDSYLRELRKCRVTMEGNGHFCRGLLAVRYDLAANGSQPAGEHATGAGGLSAGRHLPLKPVPADSR